MAWTYIKYLPRTEDDYATVSVAALGKTANGKISEVRVGLGAVSSTALRASDLEAALQGADATFDVLKDASQAVAGIVDPTSDPRGSADYKRDMSVVFARRALQQVLGVQD
jgi:carbon-monoxide dehydrogenase medium subunit